MDLVSGLAWQSGSKSVQGADSVGVPLALNQAGDLTFQLRGHVSAGLPLIGSSLATVHIVATDAAAAIVLGRLPGQEDAAGGLVSPLQVLRRVRDG